MSSILTNTSSIVALQTLKSINMGMGKTQNEISTGKAISTAKDNSAVWAISKVMESDVNGFNAISDSLSLGESTVAVARQASETVTDLLTQIKGKIVAAQEQNVDRTKIQTDITSLTDQIGSVVGAAQFNGLNLVSGFDSVNILSSLNRANDGTVTASNITVARQDLSTSAGAYGTGASLAANATASAGTVASTANSKTMTIGGTIVAGDQYNLQVGGKTVSFVAATTAQADVATGLSNALNAAGLTDIGATVSGAVVTINSTSSFSATSLAVSTTSSAGTQTLSGTSIAARAETVTFGTGTAVNQSDGYRVAIGGVNYDYVAGPNEGVSDVANGLKAVIDAAGLTNVTTKVTTDATSGASVLMVDNAGTSQSFAASGAAGGTATGGLFALSGIDVTTDNGAAAALKNIEVMIQTSIDGAASFGSVGNRLTIQKSFIGKLSDSLQIGIGAMVDANMEEASARLQALQVQQQLGIQSLSIANKAPQKLLSLFR